MEISKIKKALIEQKRLKLPGNLYYKTQIDLHTILIILRVLRLLRMKRQVSMILVLF